LGRASRKLERDLHIVDFTLYRRAFRSLPHEASIRIDLYLTNERTRTIIGQDRRPCLAFGTHHRSQTVQVTICDVTSRGGVESKIGEDPTAKIEAPVVND